MAFIKVNHRPSLRGGPGKRSWLTPTSGMKVRTPGGELWLLQGHISAQGTMPATPPSSTPPDDWPPMGLQPIEEMSSGPFTIQLAANDWAAIVLDASSDKACQLHAARLMCSNWDGSANSISLGNLGQGGGTT